MAIAAQFPTPADYLAAFATDRDNFSQFYDADYEECPFPVEREFLTISTIHSAKGLEWDNVVVMGLCEGNFPNPFFCKGESPDEQREFFNGELKKMYVASTRARDSLFLTYPATIRRKGYTFQKQPSRFLQGIPAQCRLNEFRNGIYGLWVPVPGGRVPFIVFTKNIKKYECRRKVCRTADS